MNTSSPSPAAPTTTGSAVAPGPTSASMSVSVPSPASDDGNDSHSLPSPGADEGVSYTSGSGSGSGVGAGSEVGAGAGAAPKGHTRADANGWKKRVSTACLACKKSKRKCSGTTPCDNCRAFNRVCIFDESLDQRRRVAAKRTADELTYHRDLLDDLFRLIRAADEPHALRLLDLIRRDASADEIRGYIDETLAAVESRRADADAEDTRDEDAGGPGETEETIHRLRDVRHSLNVEGAGPSFRRKVMDIHFLCDEAPCKVPAKPWTSVSDDDDLVSHLVSLYFTWDYPFYSFLDRDVFLRHMAAANLASPFCSPFLVNAVLANACHFSEFSEAYVVPGDIMTKGADFLAEAERLRDQETARIGLSSLQGTLLLYERYSLSEDDDLGYKMLHEAIRTGESLGLVGDKGLKVIPEQLSYDMDVSLRRTAWGLFHLDTVIHTGFLRPSLITKVNLNRIDRNTSNASDLWIPYPSHRNSRPACVSQYFDEACNLSAIAMDISRRLFADDTRARSAQRRQVREELYERLRRWHARMPEVFATDRKPPPYIILLRMRYHTLVINLFASTTEDDDTSSVTAAAPQTPESPPRSSSSSSSSSSSRDLTQTSARSIAALTRLHRREYGMSRAHHFSLYAVNLALFSMLDSDGFDVLDADFLSLASAFSVIASRSHLGRNLFHIFRQSVRAKAQGRRVRESSAVSAELKELFDEEAAAAGRLDGYASGLEKLDRDERYRGLSGGSGSGSRAGSGSGDSEGNLQRYAGLGLLDMLDRYESLSLGKDEIVPGRGL